MPTTTSPACQKVTVLIAFEVEGLEDEGEGLVEMTASEAQSAANMAAFDYLTFVLEETQGHSQEAVEVHADGYGKARVRLLGPDADA